MKRNMTKIAEQIKGKIPDAYQLKGSEWLELAEKAREPYPDALWDALIIAFRYGFALAQRYEKNKRKKVLQTKAFRQIK